MAPPQEAALTMLAIRKEQYAAFVSNEIKKFEAPTYLYLNERYPEQCQDLGETKLRKLIQLGIKRAASYGISNADQVRIYIDLMMLLGRDFDSDPQHPWAKSILEDESLKDQKIKAARLLEASRSHLSTEV